MTAAPQELLHYEELTTDGELLIAVHGLLGNHGYYDRLADKLKGFNLVAVDLMGFGASPKPVADYTPDYHAAALGKTIELIAKNEPVKIIAHSLGGAVALRHAASRPDTVNGLTIFGSPLCHTVANGYETLREASVVNSLLAMHKYGQQAHKLFFERTNLAAWATDRFLPLSPSVASGVNDHTYASFAGSIHGLINRPGGVESDIVTVLDAGIPTKFMYGLEDKWVNAEARTRLEELQNRGLQLEVVEGDHHLPQTNPVASARVISS